MEAFVRRVLLVDDDESVRTALTLLLQREGWEVTTCSSVDEAERDFPLIPCDVVLSDLVMQDGKGGMELLASLRTHDPRIAFVVMSGYLTDDRFKEILQAGASDCLAKPLETDDLVRALTRAIVLRSSVEHCRGVAGEHAMVLTVPAELKQRSAVMAQVDVAAQAGGFDLRRNRILMALDEAYTNAVIHGAQGNRQLTIEIRASFSQHGGVVTVSDPGPGFDPVLVGMMNDEAHRRRGLYLLRAACDDTRWLGRGNVCQMLFRQPMADEFASKRETTVTNLVSKIRRRGTSSSKLVAVKQSAI
jgi:CheY-like chemotaxis protein/anti-sigma regulatory factor (Ser/Thr protein kinase)